jgi:glycosyltransferase involved in cell wall biosynthesis
MDDVDLEVGLGHRTKYQGSIEAVNGGEIVGWCLTPLTPNARQFVSFYDGDDLVGTAVADRYRADLAEYGGDGHHGFSFALPSRFADGLVRHLSVFVGPTTLELSGSPVRVRAERARDPRPAAPASRFARKRAAVVCWDLGHNPAGRAHVLYKLLEPDWNVDLIGPFWPRFGTALWAPLRNETLSLKSFRASSLVDVWREGAIIALAQSYDLVVICKPRLPGLILGLLIAEQSHCPIVIDVDELETAFNSPKAQSNPDQELLDTPFESTGTDLAQRYLEVADAMTISNPALQDHFPARVVRHARDETATLVEREFARRRLGFASSDFVIAFIGTARRHKGLSHVFSAMQKPTGADIKLLLAGLLPPEIAAEIKTAGLSDRVIIHPQFDMSELGHFLAAADLVPVLQDADSVIAKTQMPAKLSDALQYGVAVVASDVPPFRDMAAKGALDVINAETFADYLVEHRFRLSRTDLRDLRRRIFEEDLSFAVNRPRLALAIREAFDRFDRTGTKVRLVLRELLAETRNARLRIGQRSRADEGAGRPDIAFFWKQNDSGLFGRRSDMVVKHLLGSGRTGAILHFDHPVSLSDLRRMARARQTRSRSTAALQAPQTIERALGLADTPRLRRRLFLSQDKRGASKSLAGEPTGDRFDDYVERELRVAAMDPARTIAWLCPIVEGFEAVHDRVAFGTLVVDLIDDQRTWPGSESRQAEVHEQYQNVLRAADRVFTNCEGNRRRFASAREDIVLVPNGAELFPTESGVALERPHPLRMLEGPIVGYLGNLRERIDWDLVLYITGRKPRWNFVFAGPVEEDRLPDWVGSRPNLILPGPVLYDDSRAWIGSFDVAIMPHLKTPMTESMNPLKLYNYLAAGAPVVTTSVDNIDDLADLIWVRDTPDGFLDAIETLLASPRPVIPPGRLQQFSWTQRVDDMLDRIGGSWDELDALGGSR